MPTKPGFSPDLASSSKAAGVSARKLPKEGSRSDGPYERNSRTRERNRSGLLRWSQCVSPCQTSTVAESDPRYESGGRVADVGCGADGRMIALGQKYPNSSFAGYDTSEHALKRRTARRFEKNRRPTALGNFLSEMPVAQWLFRRNGERLGEWLSVEPGRRFILKLLSRFLWNRRRRVILTDTPDLSGRRFYSKRRETASFTHCQCIRP